MICSFDLDLNFVWRKSYKTSNVHRVGNFRAKIDLDGSIVCFGSTVKDTKNLDFDPFEFRCSQSGDSLLMVCESMFSTQRVFDFLIKPDSSGYIVFGSAKYPPYPFIDANGAYYNRSFIREQVREVPNDVYWSHTVKWIDDKEFFISGNKNTTIGYEVIQGVGLLRLDTAFNPIDEAHFNLFLDSASYPGWVRSFDFIDINDIYFTGTKNYKHWIQTSPSWITRHKFDSNLNTVYERYYGGDVMNAAWHVNATDDGGCIMLGIKYDYNLPGYDYNLFLIKTDENGLVTSINEETELNTDNTLMHPNPCTSVIAFNNDLSLIEIFSQTGQIVLRYENYHKSTPISVDYFKPGIYIYKVLEKENGFSTGKLIKM